MAIDPSTIRICKSRRYRMELADTENAKINPKKIYVPLDL